MQWAVGCTLDQYWRIITRRAPDRVNKNGFVPNNYWSNSILRWDAWDELASSLMHNPALNDLAAASWETIYLQLFRVWCEAITQDKLTQWAKFLKTFFAFWFWSSLYKFKRSKILFWSQQVPILCYQAKTYYHLLQNWPFTFSLTAVGKKQWLFKINV